MGSSVRWNCTPTSSGIYMWTWRNGIYRQKTESANNLLLQWKDVLESAELALEFKDTSRILYESCYQTFAEDWKLYLFTLWCFKTEHWPRRWITGYNWNLKYFKNLYHVKCLFILTKKYDWNMKILIKLLPIQIEEKMRNLCYLFTKRNMPNLLLIQKYKIEIVI